MSEFNGLRKHEKTQHALVVLGSAAIAAAVALPRSDFPERDNKVYEKTKAKQKTYSLVSRLCH